MPEISLTDFVDFVLKAGPPKLTKVREIKTRVEYSPKLDFWKILRDGIRDFHKTGQPLEGVLSTIRDSNRLKRYPDSITAYKKWARNAQTEWFEPPFGTWVEKGLTVRVNPELGIRVDGVPFVIKLYFKAEALTGRRLAIVLQIMNMTLAQRLAEQATLAVLDVSKGKLFPLNADLSDINPLLVGEAAAFVAMWNAI